jgi:tetratricopeptide (TPR) repeat protein
MKALQPRSKHKQSVRSPEFLRTAKALLLRRRTAEAINLLRRGLNLDPTCNEAALLLAKSLVADKRLQEARSALEKLLARLEGDLWLDPLILLVRVLLAQHDASEALRVLEQAREIFPEEAMLKELQTKALDQLDEQVYSLIEESQAVDHDHGPEPEQSLDEEDLPTINLAMMEGDPEDHPTAPLPEGIREALEVLTSDTVPIPDTSLVLPPTAEELSTSPQYREASDGALEDRMTEHTPTPLPADDLGFDRFEPSEDPADAPDMISAVKRLVEPEAEEERPSLFEQLLGDGPPLPHTPPGQGQQESKPRVEFKNLFADEELALDDDPDELGGPTPAASPAAKLRQVERVRGDPTRPLRKVNGVVKSAAAPRPMRSQGRFDARVVKPLEPSPKTLRDYIQPNPSMATATATEIAAVPRRQPSSGRRWPLWFTVALLAIAVGTVAGLVVRQKNIVSRSLRNARVLSRHHRTPALRQALHKLRRAADLGGRTPEVVALAAAIHGELAFEFGESDLKGVRSLTEEAGRLGAAAVPGSSGDLVVARIYLRLAQEPLPDAITYLARKLERYPHSDRLLLLYGEALTRNGQLSLARKVLEDLPADHPQVLKARAILYWRTGSKDLAVRLLQSAKDFGLDPRQTELLICRIRVEDGNTDPETVGRLRSLIDAGELPRSQLAWASLMLATYHQGKGQANLAGGALGLALNNRPLADAEFNYQAARLQLTRRVYDQAQSLTEEAARIAPRDPRFVTLLAKIDLAKDRPHDVIRRLAPHSEQLSTRARLILTEAYLREGETDKARSLLEILPKEASPHKQLLWARLHLRSGKPYRALRELSGIEHHLGRELYQAEVIRGLVAVSVKDTRGTVRWMEAALKKEPGAVEALWAMAKVAYDRGDAKLARHYLTLGVKANRYHRRIRLDLGDLLLQLGESAAARVQFDTVLSQNPANQDALWGVARAAVELRSKDADFYLRALRVRGHLALAERLSARLLMNRGEWTAAAKSLRRIMRGPDRPELHQVKLWLAETERALGNDDAANALYRRLVRTRPTPAAHLALSELALENRHLGSAQRHALAAMAELRGGIFPQGLRARAKVQLARCYRQGDALGASIAELQDVLELDRGHFAANLELGQIYAALNKRDRAIQHLAQARRSQPTSVLARKELARVCQELASPPADCLQK